MKNALHFHDGGSPHEASSPQSEQTYSLLEASQVMGLPLSDLREILNHHELHPKAGRRGARVSRREVLDYVSRHQPHCARARQGISL